MVKGSEASVRPDSVGVEFDDERLIANAGLVLIATLSQAARHRAVGRGDGPLGRAGGRRAARGARCSP